MQGGFFVHMSGTPGRTGMAKAGSVSLSLHGFSQKVSSQHTSLWVVRLLTWWLAFLCDPRGLGRNWEMS